MSEDHIEDPLDPTLDEEAQRKVRDHVPPPPPPGPIETFMHISVGIAGIVIIIHIIRIWIYGGC